MQTLTVCMFLQVELNGRLISIISDALGGTNVDNCPHACVARPCGPLAKCVPHLENYECQCNPTNALCNKAEELSSESISMVMEIKSTKSTTVKTTAAMNVLMSDNTTPYPIVTSMDGKVMAKGTKLTMSQIKFRSDNPLQSSTELSIGGNVVDTHLLNENENNNDDDDDDDDDYYDDDYKYDDSNSNNKNSDAHVTSLSNDNTDNPKSNEFIINQEYVTDLPNNEGDEKQQAFHVMGRYMSVDNEQLLKEERQENEKKLKKFSAIKNTKNKKAITYESDRISSVGSSDGEYMTEAQINDETSINFYSEEDALTTKELIDDMERIMKNGEHIRAEERHKTKNVKKNRGACFTGSDSYFHYNDAETMREIISYKIDLNLRFKTHSMNGLILWTGRHSALEDDDYLSLGIENGYVNEYYSISHSYTFVHRFIDLFFLFPLLLFSVTFTCDTIWDRGK